jgi:predicted O-methyltransferase YrrM
MNLSNASNSLTEPRVQNLIASLHAEADRNDPPLLAAAEGKDARARTTLLDRAFIPVDADAGRFLYALVRGCAPGRVVEFGASFGISTLYIAAALRDRGQGSVVTTELHAGKAAAARGYFEQAGLHDIIDLRVGDALETLKDVRTGVSLVFLDGWKDIYLPVLHLLEPALTPGALIVADDLNLFPDALAPYLAYVRQPANGYVSATVPIGDGMEVSVRTSRS